MIEFLDIIIFTLMIIYLYVLEKRVDKLEEKNEDV